MASVAAAGASSFGGAVAICSWAVDSSVAGAAEGGTAACAGTYYYPAVAVIAAVVVAAALDRLSSEDEPYCCPGSEQHLDWTAAAVVAWAARSVELSAAAAAVTVNGTMHAAGMCK